MKRKLLIICDSHGAGYGTTGFAETLAVTLAKYWETDIRLFGGIPVSGIVDSLKSSPLGRYDAAIVQVGNPDVHPRMPIKPLRWFRARGFSFMRDSLFTVPPSFSVRYFLRLPFFLIRLGVIRVHQEFVTDIDSLKSSVEELLETIGSAARHTIVLPLFEVKSFIYTSSHNGRAKEINQFLDNQRSNEFLVNTVCSPRNYGKFYNRDGFHFTREYHDQLAGLLTKELTALTDDGGKMCVTEEETCAV